MYSFNNYWNASRNFPLNQAYFASNPPYVPYYLYNPTEAQFRSLPPIDPTLFMNSAKSMRGLMTSANTIIEKFASSRKYSTDMMTAAQLSKMSEVYELIESLGIKDKPLITFTPDGINIQFEKSIDHVDLCHLTLKIRWG
jgi:hypothetical protein